MLDNCKTAKERWGGVSSLIDRWLQERQEMLVQYCNLTTNSPNAGEQLQKLCQILVDYVSAGHFEVYDQLIKEGREFEDTAALKKAGELYDTVDQTTEFVLDFNDKYQEVDDLTSIDKDLSRLGEVLATRFEAEDNMIDVLHTSHKSLV